MRAHIVAPVTSVAEFPGQSDRRHGTRTPALFSLLYSGIDNGRLLIGSGMVANLAPDGVGIHGNRLVTPGMQIALYVDLPGIEEPLCIAQSRVSWVAGRRFGVELESLTLEERDHLRVFLWDQVTHLDYDRCI